MTTEPSQRSHGLHVGAVVYCRALCPPDGGAAKAKDRRVIILQLPTEPNGEFIGIVTATCRLKVNESQEVEIPHRPDGLSLGASKPATHGRFKTSIGVNVQ